MRKRLPILIGLTLLCFNAHAKTKVYHTCSPRDSPEDVLACAIYSEARSEGWKGMWAVGNVILNRRNHKNYPTKIKKVVYQKGQFTYTKQRKILVTDKESWVLAKKASKSLILLEKNFHNLRCSLDPTGGSIFFYKKGVEPRWMKVQYEKKLTYRRHVFYADVG